MPPPVCDFHTELLGSFEENTLPKKAAIRAIARAGRLFVSADGRFAA
jgi:hypothetical protein